MLAILQLTISCFVDSFSSNGSKLQRLLKFMVWAQEWSSKESLPAVTCFLKMPAGHCLQFFLMEKKVHLFELDLSSLKTLT